MIENAADTKARVRVSDNPRKWCLQLERKPGGLEPGVAKVMRSAFFGNENWPLVFLGDVGSGKSCAALTMLDGCGGWYYTFGDWCQRLRDSQAGELFTSMGYALRPPELWEDLGKVNLFVLDELGMRPPTSAQLEWLGRTMDLRRGKPTIYISNLTLEQLGTADMYTDRIASRLSVGTLVTFTGDRRVAAALGAEQEGNDD